MKFDYQQQDIIESLRKVGITNGDQIFIHSNIGFFGQLEHARSALDYYEAFKNSILEVIGVSGTLIVPTFSYSFCWGNVFDKNETPGICGLFSEMLRKDPQSLRSEDANFSVAAIGKNAEYFISDPPEHSFGENCFYERFLQINGKFLTFNLDLGYLTFIHYIEKCLEVPYRYDKPFNGTLIKNSEEHKCCFYHFVYDLEKPETNADSTRFGRKAKVMGVAKQAKLGKGEILAITAKDSFDLIMSELQRDPSFLIRGQR